MLILDKQRAIERIVALSGPSRVLEAGPDRPRSRVRRRLAVYEPAAERRVQVTAPAVRRRRRATVQAPAPATA